MGALRGGDEPSAEILEPATQSIDVDDRYVSTAPPDAPRPRGDVWSARPSHRRVRSVPAGVAPSVTAVFAALTAPEKDGGLAAASHTAAVRSAMAQYFLRKGNRSQ